ncbi:sugar ABC transporter permease [Paenibacillus psychroresistens]|uniref:Sugar ABC transporter permease n=1 Tax=Paenibacillus psychroresistens TaxID=1778678 RepID=A0A6B8RVU5_9BACL|nr:ABC transporter permease subunit [Paenibacillus psychroresistens]QGQ99258.1 sugar ABC transporter permease [Paenibacillus psychroresistens]
MNPQKSSRSLWKVFKKNGELFTLTLPGLIYVLIFAYIPMVGIIVAFKNYRFDKGLFGSEWAGFKNFEFFFVSDQAWILIRNTILYNAGYIVITAFSAILLALLLNEVKGFGIKIYQTIMFLPYFVSYVLVSYITYAFLDHQNGYLNELLQTVFSAKTISWYTEAHFWPFILNIVHLWKSIGFSTLVYFAAIIAIDPTYYEAAKIDGASRVQMVMKISIPLITPVVATLFILSIGNMFRGDFGLHYFVPNNSTFVYDATDVIDTYVYRALRVMGNVSMAAAVGLFQSVVGLILIVLTNFLIKKANEENAMW